MSDVAINIVVNSDNQDVIAATADSFANLKSSLSDDSDVLDLLNEKFNELIRVTAQTNDQLNDVNFKLADLNATSNDTTTVFQQTSTSTKQASTDFNEMNLSLTDLKSGFQIVNAALQESAGLIDSTNTLGTEVGHANMALNDLSNNQAPSYIAKLRDATGGLVDDMTLAHDSSLALSSGLVENSDQMAQLAHDGATLGEVFLNSAEGGVNTLELALEGNTRGLKQLGISAADATALTKQLVADGMDPTEAKLTAIMQLADEAANKLPDAFSSTGTAVERLKVELNDFWQHESNNVSQGIEGILGFGMAYIDVINGIHDKKQIESDMENLIFNTQYGPPVSLAGNPPSDQIQPQQMQYGPVAGMNAVGRTGDYAFGLSEQQRQLVEQQQLQDGLTKRTEDERAARQDILNLIDFGKDSLTGYTGVMNSITAEVQQQNALWERRKTITSESAAFGTNTGDQLYSSGSSQLAADMAKFDKEHGIKSSDSQTEVMNAYKIATGEATAESIKFDEIHQKLTEQALKGKISFGEEASALALLANMAKDGTASLTNLQQIEDYISHPHGPKVAQSSDNRGFDLGAELGGLGSNAVGADGKPKGAASLAESDPFAPLKKGADDAGISISTLQGTMTTTVQILNDQGKTAADFASPIISQANIAAAAVANIRRQLIGLTGNLSVSVGFTGVQATTGSAITADQAGTMGPK